MKKIPLRIRGYYRALKRKEKWALDIDKHPKGSLSWLMAFYFRNVDIAEELKKTPFWFGLEKESHDAWKGSYIVIPFKKKNEWP